MRQRIGGVSAYFDYMRVADTIDSQKSEDRDITDKLPQRLLATNKVPRVQSKIFYFPTGKKSSVAYVQVIIISIFST
jgi:hypothetical protein